MYHDASRVVERLIDKKNRGPGLKSMALATKVKNKTKTFAIASETLKYKSTIDAILNEAKIKTKEIANNRGLLYVMLYDHLFGQGIKGGGAVKRSIIAHDSKLQHALKKVMKNQGVTEKCQLVPESVRNAPKYPRFARVNLGKTTVEKVKKYFENESTPYDFAIDETIPYLLRFPSGTDLHEHPLVVSGELILQDKSSCFPAHALHLACESFDIDKKAAIDATAAPGNKTSQLASLGFSKIFAFDKSKRRLETMDERMRAAGFDSSQILTSCEDFLKVDPNAPQYANVKVILADPSCSGSGMQQRLDHVLIDSKGTQDERLDKLAEFQIACVTHAMKFPNVELISYSTCSIHAEENENVVVQLLENGAGRFKLCQALPMWRRRGRKVDGLSKTQAACLVRVDPKEDETCGFFVALFRRCSAEEELKAMTNLKRPSSLLMDQTKKKIKSSKS